MAAQNLTKLRQKVDVHFNLQELKLLCDDLGVDIENLPGETRIEKVRELIAKMQRDGRLDELEAELEKHKPKVFAKAKSSEKTRKKQLDVALAKEVQRVPGGTISPESELYVKRSSDDKLNKEILQPRNIIVIRGHNEVGKSSLLQRGLNYAKENGRQTIFIDFQGSQSQALSDANNFFLNLAISIGWRIGYTQKISPDNVTTIWNKLEAPQPQDKLFDFVKEYILPKTSISLVLAMDEVNLLFNTPIGVQFYSLLRTWHSEMAIDKDAWNKLTILVVLSTKPYLLAKDLAPLQWTFGKSEVFLREFSQKEVQLLNKLYGYPLTNVEVEGLLELLGGHPCLTDIAMHQISRGEFANWHELVKVAIDEEYSPFRDHLGTHYFALEKNPSLKSALKSIIHTHSCPEEHFLRLHAAGLVKKTKEPNKYQCRYELYQAFFRHRL